MMFIMRGLPGSGKSTAARRLAADYDAIICSADDYFVNSDTGEYEFNGSLLRHAHQFCQKMAASALRQNRSVVIDNTNIKRKDVEVYVELARRIGVQVSVVSTDERDVDVCFSRNTHGVPREVIQRMKDQYQS